MRDRERVPELYETERIPAERKIIHQAYILPRVKYYWLISEYDRRKNIAFGYANLNNPDFAEWGYIDTNELASVGAEPVRDWKPVLFSTAKKIIEEKLSTKIR